MNKKDLEEIKQSLLDEKKNLEEELSKFAKKNPSNPEDYETQFEDIGTDETDSSSEVASYGLNLTLEKTLEKSLRDVNKALERIGKKNYGICQYCKQEIDVKRLKARPTSNACVACKTKLKSL
jgi:DnaK suppressor protein